MNIKLSLFLIFLLLFNMIVFADNNKNNQYIYEELANIDKLIEKGKFTKGYVIKQNDTIHCELLNFSGVKKKNAYLFCVCKMQNSSIKIYKADDINGYKIGKEVFIKHISSNEHYFIKHRISGKVSLFERLPIPSDQEFLYYLKFPEDDKFAILSPDRVNISEHQVYDNRSGKMQTVYTSEEIHKKFIVFASNYLNDCPPLLNKIKAEFYTIADVPDIINEYNSCSK